MIFVEKTKHRYEYFSAPASPLSASDKEFPLHLSSCKQIAALPCLSGATL